MSKKQKNVKKLKELVKKKDEALEKSPKKKKPLKHIL